jgi:hypothetical protein
MRDQKMTGASWKGAYDPTDNQTGEGRNLFERAVEEKRVRHRGADFPGRPCAVRKKTHGASGWQYRSASCNQTQSKLKGEPAPTGQRSGSLRLKRRRYGDRLAARMNKALAANWFRQERKKASVVDLAASRNVWKTAIGTALHLPRSARGGMSPGFRPVTFGGAPGRWAKNQP